jgi:serine kinase of HPr protein (carbohydrate metabolism regulator)
MIVHADSVARFEAGRWRAALLFGPSGAGKSDLALRLMLAGWRLVADDYSRLWMSGGRIYARSPAPIRGLIEARGVGIVGAPFVDMAEVALAVVCVEHEPERLPAPDRFEQDGVSIPRLSLKALEASAVAKLTHALALASGRLGAGGAALYEAPVCEAEPAEPEPPRAHPRS